MGRSRKHRKQFPCGHRGQGRGCQRCEQEKIQAAREAAEEANRRRSRQEWNDSFRRDPIDLRGLPKQVIEKARHVIQALHQGTPYHQLKGVRFEYDRKVIRIRITHRYRMLCDDIDGKVVPREVMTHASYNNIARNTKR